MPQDSAARPSPATSWLSRRGFLLAGGAAGLGLAAYAGTHERHNLQVVPVTMPIRDLPDAFVGFRFAQISDIHLKEYTEPWFLEQVVSRVNALNPELVVLTGDLISDGPGPYSIAYEAAGIGAEILTGLRAPQRFAVMGNHDARVGADRVTAPLVAHGTPVLSDSYVAIERGHDRLWLCGTKDAVWERPDLRKALPQAAKEPVILLAHEPDFADYVVRHAPAVDLMLSGHSHGGQVRLPFVGPVILPPLGRKYIQGHFRIGDLQLYVNRGIGAVGLPFRLNCPPEITLFTLRRA